MPKRFRPTPVAPQVDMLDVRLLDMFAQVESLLRFGRHVQGDAIKLRGIRKPLTAAQQRTIARRIRRTVRDIDRESRTLRTVVATVVQAAADLETELRRDGSPPSLTPRRAT